jgi:hypothetical protein
MWEAPGRPGKTIGSWPARWLLKQLALNSDPRTGAAACAMIAASCSLLGRWACPACRSEARAAGAACAVWAVWAAWAVWTAGAVCAPRLVATAGSADGRLSTIPAVTSAVIVVSTMTGTTVRLILM